MPNISTVGKPIITGVIAFGDSLSDEGRKYNEDICGCIPFKWFLHHSNYDNFTNGHTWAYIFANVLNNILKEKANWLAKEKSTYFKNVAEGGATTYDYRNISSFFKHIKGFIMSFFLGNIQKQSRKVKKDKNILNPNKLGIIFAGANDLVTLGYDDEKGVERAIQGIHKIIETLTNRNGKIGSNYLKNLLLIGLPDISETPRFKNKSNEERSKMKLACQQYNQKLQELANEYQYVNFNCCTIYQYTNINCLDLNKIKDIKKAILVTGKGKNRTVLFINNGELITDKSNQELKKVTIKLSKEQLAIFSKDGEIIRDEANGNKLDKFVKKITKEAKLDVDLKMLDIGIIFDKIFQNPQVYEFTSGCAVYYLPIRKNQETDESLISKNIHTGNAVIIKKAGNGFFSYLIKDGKLVKKQENLVQVKLFLSKDNQTLLEEKIAHASGKEVLELVGMEGKHDLCIIRIIQSVIEQYKLIFNKEIKLIKVDDSVLEEIKKRYSNRDTIFWDDLHPARRVHDILASNITEFIESKYLLNNPSNFRDDSAIGIKPKLPQSKYAEAPASLLYPNNTFRS